MVSGCHRILYLYIWMMGVTGTDLQTDPSSRCGPVTPPALLCAPCTMLALLCLCLLMGSSGGL
ncbi:hypothetical protein GDO81_028434 [Engystomops pustulosus]|uniref:Uncharacterized protein n=1 Tax=Engystomops pustulosus TaxID=76066 RepID=A0AAV6YD85_ENGPU|nr:hypothetical protein GDO81_028434 [Engystomops pustulosus]